MTLNSTFALALLGVLRVDTDDRVASSTRFSRATCELPVSSAAAEGVNPNALKQLLDSARATRSDAFVVMKNGRIVAEWYSSDSARPIQTMSVTKSIVGLAVGKLVQQRLLDSIEQPVSALYPEWKQGRKRSITIRQLLSHTSGLQDLPGDGPEIAPAPDAVRLAVSAELMAKPGAMFFYSNKGANLLAGITERASGIPIDRYINEQLLRPLCIDNAEWQFRDSVGTPYGMAGLMLRARDLAKIGQMMLDGGRWNGKEVLSAEWVKMSVRASQTIEPRYGLLWWIEPEWSASSIDSSLLRVWGDAGVERDVVDRVGPLAGRRFVGAQWSAAVDSAFGAPSRSGTGMRRLADATRERGVPMRRVITGPSRGFYANGSLGQWLFVLPEEKLVVVRQIARRPDATANDNFENLPALTYRLLARSAR